MTFDMLFTLTHRVRGMYAVQHIKDSDLSGVGCTLYLITDYDHF